jgi:2-oxo-3-hexenedioate decarboxylase
MSQTMNEAEILALAETVDTAAASATEIAMLTGDGREIAIDDAYAIQSASIARRLDRGERVVGMKMGLTSRAKMEQVGVHEPIYGILTSSMIVNDGGAIRMEELCHPRIEPEVAFVLKEDLHGPVTPVQALAAVAGACAALEVIDSRYRDFKFTLPDVVADNTSAARFVLGSTLAPVDGLNLGNLGIIFEVNGEIVETGSSAAVLDHPARSLAELANMLARRGLHLRAGQIILSGGATAAVPLKSGDRVRVVIEAIGTAELRVA